VNAPVSQLIVVATLNATGQLSLKIGSGAMGSFGDLLRDPLLILEHPFFLVGAVLYSASFALYVNALSQTKLSVAYPFIGLTYVIVVLLSVVVLNEPISIETALGAVLVFLGVSLIGAGGTVV